MDFMSSPTECILYPIIFLFDGNAHTNLTERLDEYIKDLFVNMKSHGKMESLLGKVTCCDNIFTVSCTFVKI